MNSLLAICFSIFFNNTLFGATDNDLVIAQPKNAAAANLQSAQKLRCEVDLQIDSIIQNMTVDNAHNWRHIRKQYTHNPYSSDAFHLVVTSRKDDILAMACNLSAENWISLLRSIQYSIAEVNKSIPYYYFERQNNVPKTHAVLRQTHKRLISGAKEIMAKSASLQHSNALLNNSSSTVAAQFSDGTSTPLSEIISDDVTLAIDRNACSNAATINWAERLRRDKEIQESQKAIPDVIDEKSVAINLEPASNKKQALPVLSKPDPKVTKPIPAEDAEADKAKKQNQQMAIKAEEDRKKAEALAKVLKDVQAKADPISAAKDAIDSALNRMRSLAQKAVTEQQKAELAEIIEANQSIAKKLAETKKAIAVAASKDTKQLHELKNIVFALLRSVDAEEQKDIKDFLSNMQKSILHERQLKALQPFLTDFSTLVDRLENLSVLCDYFPPAEFFKIDPSSSSPYQVMLGDLQKKMKQPLSAQSDLKQFLKDLADFVEGHSKGESVVFYNRQLELFVEAENYCTLIREAAEYHYLKFRFYPAKIQGEKKELPFPGIEHYHQKLAMLTDKKQSLERSHAEWAAYATSLQKLLKPMQAAVA